MRKFIGIVAIAVVIVFSPGHAQPQKTAKKQLLILPFKEFGVIPKDSGKVVAHMLLGKLDSDKYQLLCRDFMPEIVQNALFQEDRLFNHRQIAEIVKVAKCDYLLCGSVHLATVAHKRHYSLCYVMLDLQTRVLHKASIGPVGNWALLLQQLETSLINEQLGVVHGYFNEKMPLAISRGTRAGIYLSLRDRREMIYIPAGEYCTSSEKLKKFAAFYLDRCEVSNKGYRRFLNANPDWHKGGSLARQFADANYLADWDGMNYPQEKDDYPVVYVSWYAAQAFAEWAGKKLPTAEQWQIAACGANKLYRFEEGQLAYYSNPAPRADKIAPNANRLLAVDKSLVIPLLPYSCHHLVDNVSEWCFEYSDSFKNFDLAPFGKVKGDNYASVAAANIDAQRIFPLKHTSSAIGFRTACRNIADSQCVLGTD